MPTIHFPGAVSAAHHEAIDAVFRSLALELGPKLRGLLLTGSATAGAASSAESDIDLFALTDEPWWQRRRFRTCGRDIDLFIDPVARIEDELVFRRSAIPISAFATGIVLFEDQHSLVSRLQSRARAVYAGLPAAPSATELFGIRMRLLDLLTLMRDETPSRPYYAAQFLQAVIEASYVVQRRWTTSAKRTLDDLATWAPVVRNTADRFVSCRDAELYPAAVELFGAIFPDGFAHVPSSTDRIPYRPSR